MNQMMSVCSSHDLVNDAFAGRMRTNQRRILACLVGSCFMLTATSSIAAPPPVEILKELPAKGVLRLGEVIYVDDGECPPGEVKKIVGGSQKAGVARQVACVKRPQTPSES